LHYLQGKTQMQVARELSLTPLAVKGRLQRGRQELRRRLLLRGTGLVAVLAACTEAHAQSYSRSFVSLIERTRQAWLQSSVTTGGVFQRVVGARGMQANREIFQMTSRLSKFTGAMGAALIVAAFWMGGRTAGLEPNRIVAAELPLDRLHAEEDTRAAAPILVVAQVASDAADRDGAGVDVEEKSTRSAQPVTLLKYGDEQADGKKSLGGSGEMIRFELPKETQKVIGIKIHGSRYGYPRPPKEAFDISLLSDDESQVLHTEKAPYSRFLRGEQKWVTIRFKQPVAVQKSFGVVLDFHAEQTKGVYVSYDTSTGGKHSRQGLPNVAGEEVTFGGDWMIQVMLDRG
jgi:RNA polymerase sigma-70 factor (ECF subfamily)